MTKTRTRPKTYEAEMGGKKVRVTLPESGGYIRPLRRPSGPT